MDYYGRIFIIVVSLLLIGFCLGYLVGLHTTDVNRMEEEQMSLAENLTKKEKITKIMDWVESSSLESDDGLIFALRFLNETLQTCDEETVDTVYKERII